MAYKPHHFNFKDMNLTGLTEEQTSKLRTAKDKFDIFQLKLASGAATPSEEMRFTVNLFMGGLIRDDLWEGDATVDLERSLAAAKLVDLITHGSNLRLIDALCEIIEQTKLELDPLLAIVIETFAEVSSTRANEAHNACREILLKRVEAREKNQ